jgi:MFS superfamily sulfate permease-like transporter
VPGYILAGVSAILILWLLGHRKYPPALGVVLLALVYAFVFNSSALRSLARFDLALPTPHLPLPRDILQGFLLLALPQIPLSLGNSIFATEQMARDLFPERKITFRKIGLTYSIMNLAAPFFSGIPVCHGAGGMAGHCAFGARTGGSVIIYGAAFLVAGLCFSSGFDRLIHAFPISVLGVILFFEGLTLMRFLRDTAQTERDLAIALLVGALAAFLPYGFLIGMIVGTLVAFLSEKYPVGFTKEVLR